MKKLILFVIVLIPSISYGQEICIPKEVALFYYEESILRERLEEKLMALRAGLERRKLQTQVYEEVTKTYKRDSITSANIIMSLEKTDSLRVEQIAVLKKKVRKGKRRTIGVVIIAAVVTVLAVISN